MACNDHTTCIAHRPRFNMMTLVNFLILSLVASTQQHFHCTRASQFFTIQSQQITFALFFPCHVLHHSNDIKVSLSLFPLHVHTRTVIALFLRVVAFVGKGFLPFFSSLHWTDNIKHRKSGLHCSMGRTGHTTTTAHHQCTKTPFVGRPLNPLFRLMCLRDDVERGNI